VFKGKIYFLSVTDSTIFFSRTFSDILAFVGSRSDDNQEEASNRPKSILVSRSAAAKPKLSDAQVRSSKRESETSVAYERRCDRFEGGGCVVEQRGKPAVQQSSSKQMIEALVHRSADESDKEDEDEDENDNVFESCDVEDSYASVNVTVSPI
jgi:hypothetical protein